MTRTASAWLDVMNAMHATATALFPDEDNVQTTFGHPGATMLDDIVAIVGGRSTQEPAGAGGRRPRNEDVEQDVVVSVWRPGGEEMEAVAAARANELLSRLENHIRHVDTTLGGAVEWCFLVSVNYDVTPSELISKGRLVTLTCTFNARARIRSDTPVEYP